MRILMLLLLTSLVACNSNPEKNELTKTDSMVTIIDTSSAPTLIEADNAVSKKYNNDRFREVYVEKISENKFRIRGQAQMFEATISWTVEDGHNELKDGFETADAGAPAWGNFDFIIDVAKERENSTRSLLLYESSAKDGSRQNVLNMPLDQSRL